MVVRVGQSLKCQTGVSPKEAGVEAHWRTLSSQYTSPPHPVFWWIGVEVSRDSEHHRRRWTVKLSQMILHQTEGRERSDAPPISEAIGSVAGSSSNLDTTSSSSAIDDARGYRTDGTPTGAGVRFSHPGPERLSEISDSAQPHVPECERNRK